MSDPTPARLLDKNQPGVPFMRLSSEMIPHGLALISDKHRGVPGALTSENLDLFPTAAATKMENIVGQFEELPAANGSILDFCQRNPATILPLFERKGVNIICATATIFLERGKTPEKLVVLGLKVQLVGEKRKKKELLLIRLPFEKAPPDGTYVLLVKAGPS